MAIFDPQNETAPPEIIRQSQWEKLQATLNRTYRHVTYYHEVFNKAGLLPEDLQTIDDLSRLPCTTRNDLLAHQPYGLFAVPLHDVLRLHPAAGAGGPIMVGYTRNDIRVWRQMAARALSSAGVSKEDVVQITLDYALDPAAIGTQSGAEALGASVIPCSGISPERQASVMKNYRATVLAATPSQALQLGHVLKGKYNSAVTFRIAFIVGEVWSNELREEIESLLHVKAFGSYGMSEMALPGLATECEYHNGLHLDEQDVLAEVIDPATCRPLPPGKSGELVLTTLTREAVPMIRYRTGDITILHDDPCPCGRSLVRMDPTHARADDVVIVNGLRVWPDQLEELIQRFLPHSPCAMNVYESEGRDQLEILIGIDPNRFADTMSDLEMLRERIKAHLFEHLTLLPVIKLVEPRHVKPSRDGKPQT